MLHYFPKLLLNRYVEGHLMLQNNKKNMLKKDF